MLVVSTVVRTQFTVTSLKTVYASTISNIYNTHSIILMQQVFKEKLPRYLRIIRESLQRETY